MITWKVSALEKKKKCVTFSKRPTMWEAPHFDKEAETEALTEVSIGKGKVKQSTQFKTVYFD